MQRLAILLLPLLAQGAEEHKSKMSQADIDFYKWVNFAILLVGLGYLVIKFMLPALTLRAREIKKALVDSRKAIASSETRIAELNAKLSNFDGEVSSLKTRSLAERQTEAKRIAEQTAQLLGKLAAQRQAEIASSIKIAEQQLRAFTAAEAVKLANAKLSARMDSATRSGLVSQFVEGLQQQSAEQREAR